MKKALLFLSIMAPAAFSQDWSDPTLHIPSLAEQYQIGQQIKIDRLVQQIKTDDYFAGKTVTIDGYGGKALVIDRTAEAAKVPVGMKPPSVADILSGLDAETRAHVKLDVDRDYFLPSQGGGVKHEHWHIDLGGAVQIGTGSDDKPKPVEEPPTDQ